ncbi:hypothetical protein OAI33_09685 [Pirellulaceae bacterium]|nr:hypothetical protein [Pirellulaceae bacterium]
MINVIGFVKLPRRYVCHEAFKTPERWFVFSYLFMQANYQTATLADGTVLYPGDIVISQEKVATLLEMERGKLARRLREFVKLGVIKILSAGRKGTRIRILDYPDSQELAVELRPDDQPDHDTNHAALKVAVNAAQKNKRRRKEGNKQKKALVSLSELDYPAHLDNEKARESLLLWQKNHPDELSQPQLQCLLKKAKQWSAEFFCRSIDHSIENGWKSVYPAPEDGTIAKSPPLKRLQKTDRELSIERCERELSGIMSKLKSTNDDQERSRLMSLKSEWISKRDALENDRS